MATLAGISRLSAGRRWGVTAFIDWSKTWMETGAAGRHVLRGHRDLLLPIPVEVRDGDVGAPGDDPVHEPLAFERPHGEGLGPVHHDVRQAGRSAGRPEVPGLVAHGFRPGGVGRPSRDVPAVARIEAMGDDGVGSAEEEEA
jgi:hypothetical protein